MLSRRKSALVAAILVPVAVGAAGLSLWHIQHAGQRSQEGLPAQLVRSAGLKPYYFNHGPPQQFTLDRQSVSMDGGVLVFGLRNQGGATLAVTEQALGKYTDTSRDSSKSFTTVYGKANVQENMSRTTGELFTSDNTWIIVNSTTPIGVDAMKDVLKSLAPYTP